MRIASFLVGAAAGAAAAMYMNRTNKTVMMGFSQLGDNFTKAVDKAMMSMADRGLKTHKEPETNQSLHQVEDLVKKDPYVKNEVDQILTQNNVPSTDADKGQLGAH